MVRSCKKGVEVCHVKEISVPVAVLELWMHFHSIYLGGSESFRPDIQKPRQMENSVRDI